MEAHNRAPWHPGRLPGSTTVEAALLFSILLFVLADILLMTEFQADSVRMTALLSEKALSLAGRDTDTGEPLEKGGFFRLHSGKIRAEESNSRIVVSLNDVPDDSRYGESYEASVQVKKRKPVTWIRSIRALQALME